MLNQKLAVFSWLSHCLIVVVICQCSRNEKIVVRERKISIILKEAVLVNFNDGDVFDLEENDQLRIRIHHQHKDDEQFATGAHITIRLRIFVVNFELNFLRESIEWPELCANWFTEVRERAAFATLISVLIRHKDFKKGFFNYNA